MSANSPLCLFTFLTINPPCLKKGGKGGVKVPLLKGDARGIFGELTVLTQAYWFIFGGRLKENLPPTMKLGFDMIDKTSNF